MPTSTDTRTALVTGATNGIGRAVALKLAADGFTVLVHGRDQDRGAAVVAQIRAAGGQARFVRGDLGDADDVARLAAEIGYVDVLVNNGGFSWFGPTADLDATTYDALWDTNVRGAYQLVAALAPKMAERGSGSIVSLDSMAGHVGLPVARPTAPRRRRSPRSADRGRPSQPGRCPREHGRPGTGIQLGIPA